MFQSERLGCTALSFWYHCLQYPRLWWRRNFRKDGLTFFAWWHQHTPYECCEGLLNILRQKMLLVVVVEPGRCGWSLAIIHTFFICDCVLFRPFAVLLNWLELLQLCQGLVVWWILWQWGIGIEHRSKLDLKGRTSFH